MRRALFSLLVLLFSAMPLVAASEGGNSGPSCETIDLTDPALTASLVRSKITPISDLQVEPSNTGSSLSSADFEIEGPDGEIRFVRVTCTPSCSGVACRENGCEPKSDGSGCTNLRCGSLCIGSCTQDIREVTEIIIEN